MKLKQLLFRNTIAVLASAATVTAVASGQSDLPEDKRQPSKQFLQLDSNRDGYLSSSEAAGLRGFSRAFVDADADRDGRLSADEFIKAEASHERQKVAQFTDDSVVTAKVKAALIKDLELKAFNVDVETYRGRVLLSGFVDDQRQAQRAVQLAAAVRGVARVENALQLK
jgi:hyperosmotically inducible protein